MPLFSRDPSRKLKKAYEQKLGAAMAAMHRGDIHENAKLTAEADALKSKLDALEQSKS